MYDGWLTSTSYEGRFDGEDMAWHGKALMALQDKVRPLTDCSSTLA
jgi:hypothetical protein